jgi:P4 family phage/plasmid primase-like protien
MLSAFCRPGDVIEVRALGKMKGVVQSGYYKDFKKMEDTINILDKTGEHKGIYFTLNKVNPALYARRPDSLSTSREALATTSDADIEKRRWLPIDFDPKRPSDISSTDEEHDAAIDRAKEVREYLKSMGWPEPILADSGNGAHLLYAIDLPNNESATESVGLCLKALDALFSDDKVDVDTANFNAARIWKAYGTITRKGGNIPERPWRRSRVLELPSDIVPVPEELLAGLGWGFKQKEREEKYEPDRGSINLEQWLSTHGIDVVKCKPAKNGGTMYIIDTCPWDSSHVDRSAWAVQFPSGAIAAGCKHNGCSAKGWRDLRALFEPKTERDEPIHQEKHEQKDRSKILASELRLEDVADFEYDENNEVKSVSFNPARAADAICQYLHIVTTPDKRLWVYENGYYRPDGEVVIEQIFDRVASSCYTINKSKEVLKKIYLRTLVEFEDLDKNPYMLCCKNGVVDLTTGTFLEHSPEYFMTMPCNVFYKKEATCPVFIEFIEGALSNDCDRLTWIDWMVACACLIEFEYLLFLTGHGSNGKKVYETLLQAIFGAEFTEAISLEELTKSNFALGYLRRARMCISTETNPDKAKTELIKKISGNDWLSADVKNKDRIRFRAFLQMLFDSNSMCIFEDNSYGFRRRFTRVNCPYEFVDNPNPDDPLQKKKDPNLEARLLTENELSGILNLIIERAKIIIPNRKIHRREDDFESYEQQSYSVSDFIDRFIEFDPTDRENQANQTPSDLLYSNFEEYTKFIIGAKLSRKKFSRLVGNQNGEPTRAIRKGNEVLRGFRGLKFDEMEFKDFIKQKTIEYSNTPIVTIFNDLVTKSNDSITDSSRLNVTSVTIYNALLKTTGNCHKELSEKDLVQKIATIVTNEKTDTKQPTDEHNEHEKERYANEDEIITEAKIGKIERETPTSDDTRIQLAARQEYGINGWVDCRKIMAKLQLSEEVVRSWLDANYVRTDHEFGYKQGKRNL